MEPRLSHVAYRYRDIPILRRAKPAVYELSGLCDGTCGTSSERITFEVRARRFFATTSIRLSESYQRPFVGPSAYEARLNDHAWTDVHWRPTC